MNLFVTGGAGFIGSNFILYWLKRYPQDKIINLDKLTYAGNLDNLKSVENHPGYRFIRGDVCDFELVDYLLKKYQVDAIVHFAAETHVDRSIVNAAPFIKTNIEGTYVLLEAALRNGKIRFHHISTDEVFGTLPVKSKKKFNEKTPYQPRSPYSASKAASDHLVRSYHITYGLPVTISNCSNNYGPYQHPEKLIPLAITNIIENKKVPIYGDGLYYRDWLYVEDHCRALDLIIHKGKNGQTYFIGSLIKEISNLDLVKKILRIMKKDQDLIEFVADRPGHDRRYAIDWQKIHKELGWSPIIDLDQGLKLTFNWYRKNQTWWKKIKGR
ncbi:MAG: dTDP-glucose 4,6-dehydratase [Patescibacteria group bacterium]|nr:dTDP-glucose 4,6-dehydratase [Patescibacteria group bacterium]